MFAVKFIIGLLLLGWVVWEVVKLVKINDSNEYGADPGNPKPLNPRTLVASIIFMICNVILLSSLVVIPAGNRGVVFNQGTGIEERILGEGISFVMPFVESVTLVNVKIAKKTADGEAGSKDLQSVKINVLVNYHPDSTKVNTLYQTIGTKEEVEAKIIDPSVQEAVKAATPHFTAVEVIQKRGDLKKDIFDALKIRLEKNFIVLDDISIVDVQFDKQFTKAIEDKVRQEQVYQKELLVVNTAKAIAEQKVATASGDKQSRILVAQGEAERNKLLTQTTSAVSLQQLAISKWNGILPMYYMPGDTNANLLFNIPTK